MPSYYVRRRVGGREEGGAEGWARSVRGRAEGWARSVRGKRRRAEGRARDPWWSNEVVVAIRGGATSLREICITLRSHVGWPHVINEANRRRETRLRTPGAFMRTTGTTR